jgi:tetratricopeptide (TPR) repeat protein
VALFDKVLEALPGDAVTHTSKGHALKTWGKNNEAIKSYQTAIEHNAGYCEAYYALSNLKTYRFEGKELDSMLRLEQAESLVPSNKVHLYFALGKALEDRHDWKASFDYYCKGNRVKKQQSSYRAEQMTEELLSQRDFFNKEKLDQLKLDGYDDASPIFIVGLPRAGSTLLEQILSSHSMVDGTLELPNMLSIAQKLRRKGRSKAGEAYPEIIETLQKDQRRALGKQYIEETKVHRQAAPFFIDKMPNNFRHIGLIKSILPNAKIIDARRYPVACCFSGFKQLFAEGQEFSYDLDDIAQYYNDYVTLMDHWDRVLPGEVLRVRYEEVTKDIEAQVTRILDFCGLPFESACLDFHKTDRAVRTASSEQVRQPLYQSGVDHWRHYEGQLQPLIDALAPAIKWYQS